MTPCPPAYDVTNQSKSYAKFSGDISICTPFDDLLPNISHIGVSQLRAPIYFACRRRTTSFGISVGDVVSLCAKKEMKRIDASRIVAGMSYNDRQSDVRKRNPVMQFVRNPMCQERARRTPAAVTLDAAIAPDIYLSLPFPTYLRVAFRKPASKSNGKRGAYGTSGHSGGIA